MKTEAEKKELDRRRMSYGLLPINCSRPLTMEERKGHPDLPSFDEAGRLKAYWIPECRDGFLCYRNLMKDPSVMEAIA